MNTYQVAWLEQFLRPAIKLLTSLWPVMRPLLRLATTLTAATVAYQLTAIEGLGIWLAIGAGLMAWKLLFTPPTFTKALENIAPLETYDSISPGMKNESWFHEDHAYDDCPTNNWYDSSKD